MRSCKILVLGLLVLLAASCGKNTSIKGTLADAPGRKLTVKMLDVNVYKTLDTVKTDASGAFRYALDIPEGQPQFVYLYDGDTKIASLLLQKGDKVSVEADTLGRYTVNGSEESALLQQVEQDFATFLAGMENTLAQAEDDTPVAEVNSALSRQYIDYYRKALTYIITHPHSLTVIPVLYQKVNDSFPVFKEAGDAIHFRSACDSLKTVYPESAYVKALDKEAERRLNLLSLQEKMKDAGSISYPDLEMPDVKGEKVKLSEVDAKVILVQFWDASNAEQKMFNIDQLLPLYAEFHPKGFEIYSVNVDTDKTLWGTTVRNQKQPWINVCDGLGAASPSLRQFNVTSLPALFLIDGDGLVTASLGADGIRGFLKKKL